MASQIRIGVFIPSGAQTLDTATVDVLGVISKEYFGDMSSLPEPMRDAPPSVSVAYISTPQQGRDIQLTSGLTIKATHMYSDADVAPGKLDVVVVPGPSLKAVFEEGGLRWLRQQMETPGVDVLSICTGLYVCAAAGIADGKNVSGPKGLQDDLAKKFPAIKLVGEKQRWVQDGNLWSSGGVTNGNDLMAAYARASPRWADKRAVELGLALTDVGDRGQFYDE